MQALKFFLLWCIPYLIDAGMMIIHCHMGGLGEPDQWDKPIHEKLHNILAPVAIISFAIGLYVTVRRCGA